MKKAISLAVAGTLIAGAVGISVIKPAREWVKETAKSAVQIVRNFFTNEKDKNIIQSLEEQISTLTLEKTNLLADLTFANSNLQTKNEQLQAKIELITLKENAISQLTDENAALRTTITQLQSAAEIDTAEIARLNGLITQNTSTISSLQTDKSKLTVDLQTLQDEYDSLTEQVTALNNEITRLSNIITQLQSNGASIAEAFKDYNLEIDFINKHVTLKGYNGAGGDLLIPNFSDYIGEAFTVSIAPSTFASKGLTSVIYDFELTEIGSYAFSGNYLKTFDLPENLLIIKDGVFKGNYIKNLVIPNSVEDIEQTAFQDNGIENLVLGAGIKFIGINAFRGNKIEELILPDGLITISAGAFDNNKIKSLTIPDSVTNLYNGSYYGWTSSPISNVDAFRYNPLEFLHIGTGLTRIDSAMFLHHRLTEIFIPENISAIASTAFVINSYGTHPTDFSITFNLASKDTILATDNGGIFGDSMYFYKDYLSGDYTKIYPSIFVPAEDVLWFKTNCPGAADNFQAII